MELIERIRARLDHLRWSWADLARAMALSEQRVNHWRTRGVPAAQVRNVEAALKLDRYALDVADGQRTPAVPSYAELAEAWAYLLPHEQSELLADIKRRAEHNKAVLKHYTKL